MQTIWQGIAISIVLVVFLFVGLHYYNQQNWQSIRDEYNNENVVKLAKRRFANDTAIGLTQIIGYFSSSHYYGSIEYPNITEEQFECLGIKVQVVLPDQKFMLPDAYWSENYRQEYPGPYEVYASSYNLLVLRHLLNENEHCS